VVDAQQTLLGIVTTGDLTRLMDKDENFLTVTVGTVMTKAPKAAAPDELGSAVVYRMEQAGIISMPVLDHDRRVVGVVHLHDLMRAGAV
jgi:arabinose-5-phosphate isomerase